MTSISHCQCPRCSDSGSFLSDQVPDAPCSAYIAELKVLRALELRSDPKLGINCLGFHIENVF